MLISIPDSDSRATLGDRDEEWRCFKSTSSNSIVERLESDQREGDRKRKYYQVLEEGYGVWTGNSIEGYFSSGS